MSKPIILFIFEGDKTEKRHIKGMQNSFFSNDIFEIINLPAKQNIYMLYEKMKEDDFETDIVEILKEDDEIKDQLEKVSRQDIAEVYLFFDYDIQQDNSTSEDVLLDMLEVFDNETENGKLYISYPMVEALHDYKEGKCDAFSRCYYPTDEVKNYKNSAGENNPAASKHLNTLEDWGEILLIFPKKIKCLFDFEQLSFGLYREKITPFVIYNKQEELYRQKKMVFVLSAFPEFLYDYHKLEFWEQFVKEVELDYCECSK